MVSFSQITRKFVFLIFLFTSISLFAAKPVKKKTVCLNMIVKNESEVITRCLKSVMPLIDTWVIVDTGSTDGTQKIIKDVLKKIPGELHERPWVNFGHNRQEALLLCKGKADYIIFMDADDKLTFADDFIMPDLTKDFYAIPSYDNGNEYWFPRIVKTDLEWFWEGVVHEDLLCKHDSTGVPLPGIKYIYIHDGARGKDPNKALKDIKLLEEDIKLHPENSRNYFYLARSYVSANQPAKALEWFKKRAEMQGSKEEIFYSAMMIGHLQHTLNFDSKTVEDSFFKSYLIRPHRAEPLYYLACKLCERNEYEKSYEILNSALELPSEITDYMYFEKWIYDYGMLYQLALCALQTQRYQKGIECCEKLMKKTDLAEDVKTKVANLFESLHQANVKQIQKKLITVFEKPS